MASLGKMLFAAVVAALLVACGQAPVVPGPAATPSGPEARRVIQPGSIVGRNAEVVLYLPAPGDNWQSIAQRFLSDTSLADVLAVANDSPSPLPGRPVIVPLRTPPPSGLGPDGYQLIPILCYHRIGSPASAMVVTAKQFAAQMLALQERGYQVVRLSEILAFMKGARRLPPRAVAITFDDGYESTFTEALPILQSMNFPATVFLYTDFVGAGDALSWRQMEDMTRGGLIDIQAHSKSHINLAIRGPGEGRERYLKRVTAELSAPKDVIERKLSRPVAHFAYPYGDTGAPVVNLVRAAGYEAAYTVSAGGNPFYSFPYALRRTMIYGTDSIDSFLRKLVVFKPQRLY